MRGDDMRAMERAWVCAGCGVVASRPLGRPVLLAPEGEGYPLLMLPAGLTADERETACGWAMAELARQRGGWLFLVRRVLYFTRDLGRIASAVAAALVLC